MASWKATKLEFFGSSATRSDGFLDEFPTEFRCEAEYSQQGPVRTCIGVTHIPVTIEGGIPVGHGFAYELADPTGVYALNVPTNLTLPAAGQVTLSPWSLGGRLHDLYPGSPEQKAVNELGSGASSSGEQSTAKGSNAPTFLYDGILNQPDFPFVGNPAGGSPYSAEVGPFAVSFTLQARGVQNEACKYLDHPIDKFTDRVGSSLDVSIFGAPINVAEFADQVACNHDRCDAEVSEEKVFGEAVSSIVDNRIPGPRAVIPIGPIPLSIESYLHYKVGPQSHSAVPFKLWSTSRSGIGTGQLGASIGLEAEADAGFSAGIDLLIASAGIEAGVKFVDVTTGESLITTVTPTQNIVNLHPSLGLDANLLGGYLDAFVEIDLLVWSKRWSIELFRYDGFPIHDDGKALDRFTFARAQ